VALQRYQDLSPKPINVILQGKGHLLRCRDYPGLFRSAPNATTSILIRELWKDVLHSPQRSELNMNMQQRKIEDTGLEA
jgi:hypothetical protein